MKAAVFQGVGKPLIIEERPDPAPGPGEVVIKVGRAGICGSDLHMTAEPGTAFQPGTIIGHELAGEVVALGAGVTRLRVGDRVAPMPFVGCGRCAACEDGRPHHCAQTRIDVVTGYAQYSRVGANDCVVLPPGLTDEDGALIEPLAVGLQGVRKAQMPIGCRALVLGAGLTWRQATVLRAYAKYMRQGNSPFALDSIQDALNKLQRRACDFLLIEASVLARGKVMGLYTSAALGCIELGGMSKSYRLAVSRQAENAPLLYANLRKILDQLRRSGTQAELARQYQVATPDCRERLE